MPAFIIPGYEDTLYYLWRERQLPKNIAPGESDLGTPEERERLARVFAQGLGEVVGYTLPLRHSTVSGWQSGKWPFRGEHLHLLTGDSPMGFRLPLDTIPWEEPDDREFNEPVDPFAKREPLPSRISATNGEASAIREAEGRADRHVRRSPRWKIVRLHAAIADLGSIPRTHLRD